MQALSRNCLFVLGQHAPLISEAIHFHAALAVDAHQNIVVLALDAVFADDVALMEARELGRVQLGLAYFTDIPDGVRGQPVARIKAMLHANNLELRKCVGVFVRIDKGQFGGCQLFLDRDGLVLRSAA